VVDRPVITRAARAVRVSSLDAAGVAAERVVFLSDVPGVYLEGTVVRSLHADRASELLEEGAFEGGIVPKLMSAIQAARAGLTAEIGETAVVA